jgi:membrane protein required for beta-lactamase induction
VTDLIRRRAVFKEARHGEESETIGRVRDAAVSLHGWLAWIPARITAIGYAVAGHFDAALVAWRGSQPESGTSLSDSSDHLLARVGIGALALEDGADEDVTARGVRGATAANRLVFRLLLIWVVIIAAMTLYGWTM